MLDLLSVGGLLGLSCLLTGLIWWSIASWLANRLRSLPPAWEDVLRLAKKNNAPFPEYLRTPAVRRQLILRSKRPATLTNLRNVTLDSISTGSVDENRRIIGFLHPNANAGGGGERVLWAAIKATLTDPSNVVAVYVANDDGVTPASLITRAAERFGLDFTRDQADRIVVIFLTQKQLIEPDFYPVLTLLGQAIGSAVLGYEAISNLLPDILVDTTGLAFSYPMISILGRVPIIAYVHYPFVQADMLASIARYSPKQLYWRAMMLAYRVAGRFATLVMANSTWTLQHISQGWSKRSIPFTTVYPPCAVQEFPEPGLQQTGSARSPSFVYIAQFRPEKRHELVLRAFSKVSAQGRKIAGGKRPSLIFVGSVRNNSDQDRVDRLTELAKSLGLGPDDFVLVQNAPWPNVKQILQSSFAGINAMWNEHFGMGVVETMAAGLIPVVHASAGPLLDIVKDEEGVPGFFFTSKSDPGLLSGENQRYPKLSEAMTAALQLSPQEKEAYSHRAWRASQRFSDGVFSSEWTKQLQLVYPEQQRLRSSRKHEGSPFD